MKSYAITKMPENVLAYDRRCTHLLYFYFNGNLISIIPHTSYEKAEHEGLIYIDGLPSMLQYQSSTNGDGYVSYT